MHEASLMKGFMSQIEQILDREDARRAVSLKVKLGCMSHMSPDHFREHFEEAAAGTRAEGARLEIESLDDWTDPLSLEVVLESVELER